MQNQKRMANIEYLMTLAPRFKHSPLARLGAAEAKMIPWGSGVGGLFSLIDDNSAGWANTATNSVQVDPKYLEISPHSQWSRYDDIMLHELEHVGHRETPLSGWFDPVGEHTRIHRTRVMDPDSSGWGYINESELMKEAVDDDYGYSSLDAEGKEEVKNLILDNLAKWQDAADQEYKRRYRKR